jgi:hypothetical protein
MVTPSRMPLLLVKVAVLLALIVLFFMMADDETKELVLFRVNMPWFRSIELEKLVLPEPELSESGINIKGS